MKKALKIVLIFILSLIFIFTVLAAVNLIIELRMRSYVDSFAPVVQADDAPTLQYDKNGDPYFISDRDLKILQLTDVHIGGGFLSVSEDKKVINAVAAMVAEEKPDLIVVTGDVSFAVPYIAGTLNNSIAHRTFMRLMENLGVYWTVTFGNHDSEAYDYFGREKVAKMYEDESLEYCLFSGDGELSGEGNHLIHIKNSRGLITETLYMIDSHSYTDKDPLGIKWDYDYIKEDQIEWYKTSVEGAKAYNGEVFKTLTDEEKVKYAPLENPKSLIFIHIPIREVKTAYDEYVNNGCQNTENTECISGTVGEPEPYVYCSRTDEELFETALELGSTTAFFFGHDHYNNMILSYKGIKLSYGYSLDYLAYSGIDEVGYQRGCSVIIISSEDGTAEITHENYYQDKYVPLYEKESVSMEPIED